jgi:hypothetical protein
MQAVVMVLEGDFTLEVKEQGLCVLSNVADGDSAKDFILTNQDVLKKIIDYVVSSLFSCVYKCLSWP